MSVRLKPKVWITQDITTGGYFLWDQFVVVTSTRKEFPLKSTLCSLGPFPRKSIVFRCLMKRFDWLLPAALRLGNFYVEFFKAKKEGREISDLDEPSLPPFKFDLQEALAEDLLEGQSDVPTNEIVLPDAGNILDGGGSLRFFGHGSLADKVRTKVLWFNAELAKQRFSEGVPI